MKELELRLAALEAKVVQIQANILELEILKLNGKKMSLPD